MSDSVLFKEGSILSFMNTTSGTVQLTVFVIVICCFTILMYIFDMNIFQLILAFINGLMQFFGKWINSKESSYHRDLEVGKIDATRKKVKLYRFLNDLTIDLGVKKRGASPYEFLFIVAVLDVFATFTLCKMIFGGFFIAFLMYPITLLAVICILYTRANIAHDARIEAVIEAENIICNNIANGVVPAVKSSIDVMPSQVKGNFKDFIDNVESKNYHIRTALMELNSQLGSIADDFIKKCIVFETEEEHGIAGMFTDVVEINNIRMEMRTEMKRRFEQVTNEFIIGAMMELVFLGGVIAIYPEVQYFYLKIIFGQLILALDALILVLEFVYITYLRAQEL